MPIDPLLGQALLMAGGQFLTSLFGGGEQQPQVTPSDLFQGQMTSTKLLPETQAETGLAGAQQDLYRRLLGEAGGRLPMELGLGGLSRGVIPAASQQRIDQLAFGGLQQAGRRASAGATEQALSMGTPFSSYQLAQTAGMTEPLAEQAARLRAQLQMQELDRLTGLRQTALANMMALQESPALTRLLQIRMAQPTQASSQLQMQRLPGGLPSYAYETGQPGQGAAARRYYGV